MTGISGLLLLALILALLHTAVAASAFSSTTRNPGVSLQAAGNFNAGELFGWGDNTTGQLGIGSTSTVGAAARRSPVQVGGETDWTYVVSANMPADDAASGHSCGLRADNTLWCWGDNTFGQLGLNHTSDRTTPQQVSGSWADVSAGGWHTCAIRTTGTLWCWGYGGYGMLGNGGSGSRDVPTQVGSGNDWTDVAAANAQTCAINGGQLYCWGEGLNYKLGTGGTGNQFSPVRINSSTSHTSVSIGKAYGCALRGSPGDLYCWGEGSFGQLGRNSTADATIPTKIGTATWTEISLGRDHTCGLRSPGTLWCWGYNANYELGLGDTSTRDEPAQVASGITNWAHVSPGNEYGCANRADRTIYCWGDNDYGQLGQGDLTRETTPALVPGRTGIVHAGTNGNHATFSIGQ